ncbi:hypothetical protein MSG86_01220 [Acinetobacter baumannii]|uniref:hypothetical protein n=1 Tax=Acinetobacter baumannii TaxID=470 RepID=UPI0029415124|nr:hypothetical protein [Acinetobacter baumannii]MDV4266370.1 hypothetical protein [Acinetobacter baumannii]
MKNNITVVGGLYREISPKSDFFLGSGGRAALFLAEQNIDVKLALLHKDLKDNTLLI